MKPTIECAKNGPLLVKSLTKLVRIGSDAAHETKDTMALCRCGRSGTKPLCDGTHAKIGFDDAKQDGRARDRRRDYVGDELTIHDNRGICAHAAFCTERSPKVFRADQRPWIDPDAAPADETIETIRACPSGALSFTRGGTEERDRDDDDPRILVAPAGPYAVKGGVELVGVEWAEGASREHYDLCRCGGSKNKPFCDGAHWNVQFDEDAPPLES